MPYTYYIGDLRTGRITTSRRPTTASWDTIIDDAGSFTATYSVGKNVWPTARASVSPAKSFFVVGWVDPSGQERLIQGGPIWQSRYTDSTQDIEFSGAGLGSYYDHRKVMPLIGAGASAASQVVEYTAAETALIAKRLVELAAVYTGGDLPVILPGDAELGGAGTTVKRTYNGYELIWTGDALRQLKEDLNGPDIQFVPEFDVNDRRYIKWRMRIGVSANKGLLTQTGPPWSYDYSVQKGPIVSLDVASDSTKIAFRAWLAGQGEALGRPVVYADNTIPTTAMGWPYLETEGSGFDNIEDTKVLLGQAQAELIFGASPTETWSLTVRADIRPYLGQVLDGDWITVVVRDHNYIPDGSYAMRLLGRSGGDDNVVTFTLANRLGELVT